MFFDVKLRKSRFFRIYYILYYFFYLNEGFFLKNRKEYGIMIELKVCEKTYGKNEELWRKRLKKETDCRKMKTAQ